MIPFRKKTGYVSGTQPDESISSREAEHRKLAYEAACEGIVLLENDGALPLVPGKIALYGSGGISTIKGGTGSGEVNERYSVNIYDGLENAGFSVTSGTWLDEYVTELDRAFAEHDQKCRQAVKDIPSLLSLMDVTNIPFAYPTGRPITPGDVAESDTDTAVYVVARQAGETGDKRLDNGDFELFPDEIGHLRFLCESYKKTILVINSGSSMDLSPIEGLNLSAVIFFCQQGEEGGNALGAILSGKVCPSGKLTDTWARTYADIPFGDRFSYLKGGDPNEFYHEDIYVGYRYFDTFHIRPKYHFGYGLSYTDFSIIPGELSADGLKISIQAAVRNTGTCAGKETVQLYVSCPGKKLEREYQQLAAFSKTKLLAPGEEQTLDLTFDLSDCAAYDEENAAWILESGSYILRIGNSSGHTSEVTALVLDKDVVTVRVKNLCVPERSFERLHSVPRADDIPEIRKYRIDTDRIRTKIVDYPRPAAVSDPDVSAVMKKLTMADQVRICVGTGHLGMFSGKKIVTPGTVGRTTDRLFKKGLVNLNLCDGPAGIRILRRSAVKRGLVLMGDYSMSFLKYLPTRIQRFILADPEKDKIGYQYCTAFPVGTSLAQSWNIGLCERIGRAVSAEMDAFNVTFWLAPAMNIHRNPLCGRNFEYFSEDPLLTGRIAGALVRGVQSVPGNYATVKHLACNNREDNRNRSDSIVSERAMREIYLKGFRLCIREAEPKAVMSSYNKINGVYTADSYDLLTDILRNEWGFDGIVMTDWHSTGKGLGDNGKAIAAGNDLIMPGGIQYRLAVWKAFLTGKLSRNDLTISASRIVRLVMDSAVSRRFPPEKF